MIRFIATDLDGTLLDEKGELPLEIFPLVERLFNCGILFAPASGRQYANLKKLFYPVWEKLLFICENGTLVCKDDKILFLDPLSPASAKACLTAIKTAGKAEREDRAQEGAQVSSLGKQPKKRLFPILCLTDGAYLEDVNEPFYSKAKAAYTNCDYVPEIEKLIGKSPVCKISVYDPEGAREHAGQILPPLLYGTGGMPILSGEHWCDVAAAGANKGKAIREIQRIFGFSPDECMAFGDHMNDIGMIESCFHSRAVENAVPQLREKAKKIIPSNRDGGVLREIQLLLETLEKSKL